MKPITLRLDQELAEDLATVAQVDGLSVVDTVRSAVQRYLDARAERQSDHVEWDDDRPVWVHPCKDRTERITLPLGKRFWRADKATNSVAPSLWCQECGTHGWWVNGRWL